MDLSKIAKQAEKMTSKQLEIKIQLTCEKMHEAYISKKYQERFQLARALHIYDIAYELKITEERKIREL